MTDAEIETFLDALPFVAGMGITFAGTDEEGGALLEAPLLPALSAPGPLFPASVVGAVGDVAAVCACLKALPSGWAAATLDFTLKMTSPAKGTRLRARGRVLRPGRTLSTAQADLWALVGPDDAGPPTHCGTLLATTRNYALR